MISNRPKEAKIPSPDKRLLFVMITSGSCWSFTMIWCKAFGSKMYSCDEKNGPQILTNLPTVQISGVGWGYQIKGQSHIASASWLWRPKPRSWTIVQNYLRETIQILAQERYQDQSWQTVVARDTKMPKKWHKEECPWWRQQTSV